MAIFKNVSSQKIGVFAWDTSANGEKTGDAANITARISKDGAAVAQSNDVNPSELDATYAPGVYFFDMTQAETNADLITLFAKSGTANIKLEPVIIYTLPTWAASQVAQTGDTYTRLGAPAGVSVSADIAAISVLITAVKAKTDQFVFTIANKVDSSIQAAGDFAQAAADKVWSTAARVLTAGTNIVLAKGTGVTGFNDLSAAQVNAEADTALADYDAPTSAELVSEINSVQTDIATLNNLSAAQINAEVVDVLRTDTIPDSYANDGTQPTIAQAMLAIHQFLTEKSVSGVTVTVNKPNGTSQAMQFTLNDATTPSSITRSA